MQTCHACQRELDEQSLAAGRCANCGAVVRRLSQRTIEDPKLLRDRDPEEKDPPAGKEDAESLMTRMVNPADFAREGATIEITHSDTAGDLGKEDASPPQPETPSDPGRKIPTVADESNVTMEFKPPADSEEIKEASRRSTHTLQKDLTIDFSISPADLEHLDSQWRGTFDLGAKQSHTIRQKETVTGFRSSLPVKSRHVRAKRKGDALPAYPPADVPDYELLDIIGE